MPEEINAILKSGKWSNINPIIIMSNSLKFVAIYKLATLKMVTYHSNEKTGEDQIKSESSKVCIQVKSISL